MAELDSERRARIGLCLDCSFARAVRSAKGSEFWLCEKAQNDARFKKYPPLPVLRCAGFSRASKT